MNLDLTSTVAAFVVLSLCLAMAFVLGVNWLAGNHS